MCIRDRGLVRPADLMGNIPTAMWLAGPFAALAGKDTDPSVDLEFINSLLDRMERDYSIDTTRVYATGHSNGSLMTWATACRYASRFAAIAPVGYMFAPLPELDPAVCCRHGLSWASTTRQVWQSWWRITGR